MKNLTLRLSEQLNYKPVEVKKRDDSDTKERNLKVVSDFRLELSSLPERNLSVKEFAIFSSEQGCAFFLCNHLPICYQTEKMKLYGFSSYTTNSDTATDFELIALDFDNKENFVSPSQIIDRLKNIGLKATFSFETLSSIYCGENPMQYADRFRVVLILSLKMNIENFNIVYDFFKSVFPEADKSAMDKARIIYGGKRLIYSDFEAINDPSLLMNIAHSYNITKTCQTVEGREKKVRRLLNSKIGTFYTSCIYKNIESAQIVPKIRWNVKRWELACKKWEFLAKFFEGTKYIPHQTLYLLYFAMRNIENGKKYWNENIKKNINISDEKIELIGLWVENAIKNGHIFPFEPTIKSIDSTVPPNFFYKLTDIGNENQYKNPVKIYEVVEKPLEELRSECSNVLKNYLISGESLVLKAPTGIGKSTALFENLKVLNFTKRIVIAFQNHDLKDEMADRIREHQLSFRSTPREPVLTGLLKVKIDSYRNAGFQDLASAFLRNMINEKDIIEKYNISEETLLAFKIFFSETEEVKSHKGIILTTHEMAVLGGIKEVDLLIFDENPIDAIVKISKFDRYNLMKLSVKIDMLNYFRDIENIIAKNKSEKYLLLPTINFQGNKNDFTEFPNFGNFLNSNVVLGEIDENTNELVSLIFSEYRNFDSADQVIIMSATAPINILTRIFPEIKTVDLGYCQLKGKLYSYTKRGLGKWNMSLDSNMEILKTIKESAGNSLIITHKSKKLSDLFETQLNFSNNIGRDIYKDKNLLSLGTSFPPAYYSIIMAYSLGIPFENYEMRVNQVIYENWLFPIFTFDDLNLREIHLDYIAEKRTQSEGRSRLVNYDRVVFTINKIPNPQTTEIYTGSFAELPNFTRAKMNFTGSAS